MNGHGRKIKCRLWLLALMAGLAALVAVAATLGDIGLTWDEQYYYDSCLQQLAWFGRAARDISAGNWSAPFSAEVLDRYWHYKLVFNVHPPFYKLCSSLTLVIFRPWLGDIGAYRVAPALMFAVLAALLFWTVARRYGNAAGFWAAGSFVLMPRVFGHAHFGATDTPITLLWFAAALSFHRALESRRWAAVFALVYGLALATKFTALVIPLPLAAYALMSGKLRRAFLPAGIALIVSPLIMVGLNPEWWHDTFGRVYFYLSNSATRAQYLRIPTYYLGEKYDFYLPWHHSLVYTLFTVSPAVLAGFLYGFWRTARKPLADRWAAHMLIHWLAVHLVMMLPGSPGHDGVRLFLPSFPFLAVVSAVGFHHFTTGALPRILERLGRPGRRAQAAGAWVLLLATAVPAAVALARIHTYELCYYNSLAGGIPGAHRLGMETTYWYDPVNDSACRLINETLPDSAKVLTYNESHFRFLQQLGKIKPSLVFRKKGFNYILQYSRQGTFTDQDWLLYRKGTPLAEIDKEGVRLLAVFRIPQVYEEILDGLRQSKSLESLYEMALVYERLGRDDMFFQSLEKYLELKPADFEANMRMALFYLENEMPGQAIEYLRRVAGHPEESRKWLFEMGRAYFQSGQIEQAIDSFRRALGYQSNDYGARAYLGHIYFRAGRLEEAGEQYEVLLRAAPYDERALHMLGRINQVLGRDREARYYYQRLLETQPDHPATLVNLGLIEEKQENFLKAREYYSRALDADSTFISANYNLAKLLAEKGEADSAEKHFKRVLSLNPDDVLTHMALARLYRNEPSRKRQALEHYRAAARLLPDQAESIETQHILPLQEELRADGQDSAAVTPP